MSSGKRRHLIEIFAIGELPSLDSGGNPISNPVSKGKRWGSVESTMGREFVLSSQIHAETTHVIKFSNDLLTRSITPKYQLSIRGNTYDIVAAPDNNFIDRGEIRLECKQVL